MEMRMIMDVKYCFDSAENRLFLRDLREDLLSFGRYFPSPGGSSYYLGDDGTPWKDRPRETWITSRMAHVYSLGMLLRKSDSGASEGAMLRTSDPAISEGMLPYETCRELAAKALSGLSGELRDLEHGGWFAGINADGTVIPGKQCYAHAFVILASSSLYLAGIDGAYPLLKEALQIYDRYFWEESEGLACDTWDTAFSSKDDYRGLNANMHTVEAFLAVYDALHDPVYLERAGRIIRHVIGWAENSKWRIPEHFTRNWEPDLQKNREKPDDPFKPYGATPGHGIEWSRLILQWTTASLALSAGKDTDPGKCSSAESDQSKYINAAKQLYQRAIADAWNCDGAPGIVYTTDWEGKPVVHDRMHWTLAEAINTSAVLFRVTGETGYADDYAMFMEYLDHDVVDHKQGSWFHQLDRDNHLMGTVWPGKSDLYHAVQATLIPYNKEIGTSIAAACCKEDV